jgi:hypothetical protein
MKKLLAIAMVVAAAAVVGFQTTSPGRASPSATQYGGKTYCLDGQTVTTTDTFLQGVARTAIDTVEFGAAVTSAEIVSVGTDPDAANEGGSLFDQLTNDFNSDDFYGYGTWSQAEIEFEMDATVTDVTVHHLSDGACVTSASAPEPTRVAYCSVTGNTWPDGTAVTPGTFLNLLSGQPATDKHYTGAVPAWYVEGVGLTCTLTPSQAALAAASTLRAGGGGDLETPIPGVPDYGIYPYVPAK